VLEAAGSGLELVVKTTVFLQDIKDFSAFNGVYAEYFGEIPPARSTVQVAALPRGARVEIEAVALVEPSATLAWDS
jgi:2-iminobutanoate/2-iminopropanoate deaminase